MLAAHITTIIIIAITLLRICFSVSFSVSLAQSTSLAGVGVGGSFNERWAGKTNFAIWVFVLGERSPVRTGPTEEVSEGAGFHRTG